jgi:hypothetical protein
VYASSTFREERLYRKFRSAENGDLFELKHIAVPDGDYVNGPSNIERPSRSRVPPTGVAKDTPHRLHTMPKEPVNVVTTAESHDSFVEITK